MSHTPAPWKAQRWWELCDMELSSADEDERDDWLAARIERIAGADDKTVVACHDLSQISVADAVLIEAAPDLLDVVRPLRDIVNRLLVEIGPCDHDAGLCVCDEKSLVDRATYVIARATRAELVPLQQQEKGK